MSTSAILAVARFQLAGASRRRGLWAWLALAGMLANLALPPGTADYVTLSVANQRPIYTPEMVGFILGALGVSVLMPAHFVALRIAFPASRHPLLLAAATPVSNTQFALGRWLADTAFLSAFLFCFGLGGLLIQWLRGDAPVEQPLVLLGPLLLVGVPAASLLAGFRGLVEARAWTRGPVVAGILMLVAWLVILPLTSTVSRSAMGPMADPLGIGLPMRDLGGGTGQGKDGASFGIRIGGTMKGTFVWDGFDWLGPYAGARGLWFLAGAGLAVVAGLAGDRFRQPAGSARQPAARERTGPARMPPPIPNGSGSWTGLVLAELRLLRPGWKLGLAWLVAAIGVTLLVDGADGVNQGVAALLLPALFALGDLGVRAGGRSLLPLTAAVPATAMARLAAGYVAGLVLALLPMAGLLAMALVRGHMATAGLVMIVAAVAPAAALALGRLTGSGQAFSMLGLMACYALFSA